MSNTGKEVDQTEKDKRVYQIGLMLRRKTHPFIVDFMRQKWGLERAQAYRYIALARKEWQKYFSQVKKCGKSYYVAQLRDLKDEAYERKVIVGRGDNKGTIVIADLYLIFEITKEEAKLMGIYPATKNELTGAGGGPITYEEHFPALPVKEAKKINEKNSSL